MGWRVELLREGQEYGQVIADNTDELHVEVDKWEVDLTRLTEVKITKNEES